MSDKDSKPDNGNRTIFRPSPLQGLNPQKPTPQAPPANAAPAAPQSSSASWASAPNPFAQAAAPPVAQSQPSHQPQQTSSSLSLSVDDVQGPGITAQHRNAIMAHAGPVLALVASIRAGRTRPRLAQFHQSISKLIADFEQAIRPLYPTETFQRAKYALCSTVDDIVQNLPGQGNDTAEWARRSMVVTFFQENIGGDRFWQLCEDMLAQPREHLELIELYHACLAAGFEGRFRVMPDGKRGLGEVSNRLYAALDHPRGQSQQEMVTKWRGEDAPMVKVGFWNHIALAAAIALGVLMLIYIILRLILLQTGQNAWDGLGKIQPEAPLRLSRQAVAPPIADSGQRARLHAFLAPEIAQGLVVVEADAKTVRIRTTTGQLFTSGSDQLADGRDALFKRIAQAINEELAVHNVPGPVIIEGHADSDRVSSLSFPDNLALSQARAETVAGMARGILSDPSRVKVEAFGDTQPIASNETSAGKTKNRRVEVVITRKD